MKSPKGRVHSSLDKLPRQLGQAIRRMYVDNEWPADFTGDVSGKPRYVDIVEYCRQRGCQVHISSVGRYCRQLSTLARMKEAGGLVRLAMKSRPNERASDTQRALAELLSAQIIDYLVSTEKLSSGDMKRIAAATKDCSQVAIAADKYIREQIKTDLDAAKKDIAVIGRKKQIDAEALRVIREQVYGIIDKHLGLEGGAKTG